MSEAKEQTVNDLSIIDHREFYGEEGAAFEVQFGSEMRRLLDDIISPMNLVELSATEDGIHISARNTAEIVGVNVTIAPDAFDSFDVSEPGFVTMWDRILGGGLDILRLASGSSYYIRAPEHGGIELGVVEGQAQVTTPVQTRSAVEENSPPAPNAAEFHDDHTATALLRMGNRIENAYLATGCRNDSESQAEIAKDETGAAWLTFSSGADAYKVKFDGWSGDDIRTLYDAKSVYDAAKIAYRTGASDVYWSFGEGGVPLVISSADGTTTVNAFVAPRLSDDEELLHPDAYAAGSEGGY